ncbi:FadR/GntR family transcriptional regulator [Serratia sp. DD3]|uniref:FadR/GntR family transcriptional regulator n=1 Tax=Serratia sp. DD3 TaxID=1410619 RepID=UPI0003C4E387|nr:FCD domain-containing protein [Serratia sp. DD3]KEY58833.1 pyruvate dehydrogenase complex repressor [Serratia sp. DD3]
MTTKMSVVQQAIQQIEARIGAGEWAVGQRLPSQHELAKILQLSRASLRETLSYLESRGLVSIKPGKGVYVAARTSTEQPQWGFENYSLAEVLAMRHQLEGFAAAHAAVNAIESDIVGLETSIADAYQAAKQGDLLVVKLCDLDFHAQIIRIAGNRLLQEIIKLIRQPYEQSKTPPHGSFADMEPALAEHKQIFLAIKMGEPHLAREAMEQHLQNAAKRANVQLVLNPAGVAIGR